jgi:uncharacterized protein DUF5677
MEQDKLLKLDAVLKVWNEYESFTNEEYSEIISQKVGLLLELMNSLSVEKVKVDSWKIWCESVIYKMCYHISSILKLYKGTEIPYKHKDKNLIIFDEPSVIVLFRVILENYLTFYYLFGTETGEDIKQFRCLVWRYSGIKQRTEFKITNDTARAKQLEEIKLLESLKEEIKSNKLFDEYTFKQKEVILKGRKPRLFESWDDLIKYSKLSQQLFRNLYGYKSNYSHTEFISVLQVQMGNFGHNKENTKSHYLMLILHSLVCKSILELKLFFPSIEKVFEAKDVALKEEIFSLAKICSESNPLAKPNIS